MPKNYLLLIGKPQHVKTEIARLIANYGPEMPLLTVLEESNTVPCYQERTVGIELDLADTDVLVEILRDELGIAYRKNNGKIEVLTNNEETIKKIKQKYAEKIIKKTAQLKGWQVTKNGNKLQLKR